MGSGYISFGLCLSFYFQGIVKFSIFVRRGLLGTCLVLPITFKSFKIFGFSTEEVKCRNARLSHFIRYTVELQWLEHIWNNENVFKIGIVRANEG